MVTQSEKLKKNKNNANTQEAKLKPKTARQKKNLFLKTKLSKKPVRYNEEVRRVDGNYKRSKSAIKTKLSKQKLNFF